MSFDRGQTYDKYSNEYISSLGDPSVLNRRLTWNQKKAKDCEWMKQCIRFIDGQYNCYGDSKRMDRLDMNYQLANGFGEEAMRKYGEKNLIPELLEEGFTNEEIYGNFQHHPVIQQVYNAMVGEQQLRPLTPIALDTSPFSMNQRRRKKLEMSQQYLHEQIIAPINKRIEAQVQERYAREYGVEDLFSLSPEEQMNFQSEVDQRTKAATPKEILEYMRKDYKSPGSIQAQKILDFIMSDLDLKFLTDENFKNLLIAGKEIYRVGVRNGRTFIEIVNPMGFYEMSRPNSIFIEDGVAWKYEQRIMYNDLYSWHSEEIGNSKTLKDKLNHLTFGIGGRGKFGEPHPQAVYEIQRGNTDFIKNSPNVMTIEGQQYLQDALSSKSNRQRGGEVRYVHAAYKGLRKIKQITRYNSDKDRLKTIFIDESYTFNPLKTDENGYRDIEEHIMWIPEIYEGAQVENDIYLGLGATPYQYKSLDNPFSVQGPYVGGSYSKLMNNTSDTAPIDPAKAWQYKFNLQMARIHELEATDLGTVLSTTLNSIPQDWSYRKHFLMMKYGKIALTDTTAEGFDPAHVQIIKQLDLSTTNKIADALQYLDFLRHQIILSMSYNPSRLGLQGPTVPVTNNQQNIIQSSYQTNDIFAIHNKIAENLLNVGVDVTKYALREMDSNSIKGFILDDLSIAELDLNWELLDMSEINVKIKNSSQEYQDVQEVKQLLQPLAQNGMLTAPDIIRIQFSKSKAEIMNYAEDAFEKSEERARQAQEAQQQMLQKQQEFETAMLQMQHQMEMEKESRKQQMEIFKEVIASSRFAQEKDIDKDNRNDDIEKEEAKQLNENERFNRELAFKREELREKTKLEKEKMKNELQKEKMRARNKPKPSK